MKSLDNNRHFYLYAKYHYQETNLFEDLKIILAHYCGIDKKYLKERDIIGKLSELAGTHLNISIFRTFIDNMWCPPYMENTEISIMEALCRELLRILRFRTISEIPFELGKPDSNVLPLAKDKGGLTQE